MRIHCLKNLFVAAFVLCVQPAWAFLDPPYIAPANPTAGDMISVNIYGGECDLLDYGIVWPPPVTQEGNVLTILFTGAHEGDPEFCDVSVGTYTYPVGVYPPGTYTLQVNWRYSTFSGWVTETLGVIPFSVLAVPQQQPFEAPTLGIVGLGALALGLIAATLLKLRARKV